MRLSKVARSDAWMKANYNNLMKVSGFLTWGSIQALAASVTLTAPTHNQLFFSGSAITAEAAVYNASEASTVGFYTRSLPDGSFALVAVEDSDEPYTADLSALAVGNYSIYAKANNATDGDFTSDTHDFSVVAPGPVVINVTSTTADGAYKAGAIINVQVQFDTAVTVAGGTPRVKLQTGGTERYANYTADSGTDTLTFEYVVGVGDTSADLDYESTTALQLNGATIQDTVTSDDAILTLAAPGAEGSLGFNKALVIDTTAESVIDVTSAKSDGTYKAPEEIDITVEFDGTVQVTGTPQLELETGATDRQADYQSGDGTATLTFRYTVQAGDASDDLDYTGVGALTLPGGATITDDAGNDATLTLVTPGAPGSLGANKNLVIDAVAETLDSIDNNDPDNAVNTYDILTYTLTFSDDILHTTVDATDFDNAAASPSLFTVVTITETTPGVFSVQVRPMTAGNLKLRVKSDAVITDPIGNQVSNLPVSDGETIAVRLTRWALGGEGGTVTEYPDDDGRKWTAHLFTTEGSHNITFKSAGLVEYLVVAGGGSGARRDNNSAGGGGAGGMLAGTANVTAFTDYSIVVGAGGPARGGTSSGVSGDPSSFGTIANATGGGYGAQAANGGDGGSGGGGTAGGTWISGQGNGGGSSSGGGGGAGSEGTIGTVTPAPGGNGLANSITGESITYARGGRGRSGSTTVHGTDGRGDGGSGNDKNSGSSGKGGSGIVVIRYEFVAPSGTLFLLR